MSMSESAYGRMDPSVYTAAIRSGQAIGTLKDALNDRAQGIRLFQLASRVGNSEFVEEVLKLKPDLLKATNDKGNTALHEAAEGDHSEAVDILLQRDRDKSLVSMKNKLNETALFKSCQGCQVCECRAESCDHLKTVKKLLAQNPSSLAEKTEKGMTCLHVAVMRGNSGLLKYLLEQIGVNRLQELVTEADKHGEILLHLAVRRNRVDLVRELVKFESKLCCYVNKEEETPLFIAVKMGFVEIVDLLIKCMPNTVQIPNKSGMNVLHVAVESGQVKLVEFLVKTVDLTELINQPEGNEGKEGKEGNGGAGNTPLHIAARDKNFHMVIVLLTVDGVNKDAVNNEGLTPLDIARINTEYHESYKIIEKLTNYPPNCRPFMYCAPKVTPEKHKRAVEVVEKTFESRRNAELVVAVLLATMSFTAVFTIPGGFADDKNEDNRSPASAPIALGTPVLIGYNSFKVFLIFDCVAFFLSMFVVLMWQMSSPLTTGDKMVFMCITNILVCASFAFTSYGLMLAVYTVLIYQVEEMAWIVLGVCIFICVCGNALFFYLAAIFSIKRARFHRLCGVSRLLDTVMEYLWVREERCGILDFTRSCYRLFYNFFAFGHPQRWNSTKQAGNKQKRSSTKEAGNTHPPPPHKEDV